MHNINIPYSNSVRDYSVEPRVRRLTGVMMVDEMFLYKIVEEAGLGIPPADSTSPLLGWRPLHGVHLSFNRGPWKRLCTIPKASFNKMLQVDRFEEYRSIDRIADRYIAVQQNIIEIQERGKMKNRNNECQSTKTNTV